MLIDLTSRGNEQLSPSELSILVTGCLALWAEHRYADVTIRAHRIVLSQIDMMTRWRMKSDATGSELLRHGIANFEEA